MKNTLTLGIFYAALIGSSAYCVEPVGTIKVDSDKNFTLVDSQGNAISGFSQTVTNLNGVTVVGENGYSLQGGYCVAPYFRFSGITGLTMDNFSVTFKATCSSSGDWTNLMGFGEEPGTWDNRIWPNDPGDGLWHWRVQGYAHNKGTNELTLSDVATTPNVFDGLEHSYLFSMSKVGGASGNLHEACLYRDGELMFKCEMDQYFGAAGTFYLAIGGSLAGDRRPSGTFSDITVYSSAITPMDLIPEPATATLSLLALAGLAARRRRK